MPQRNNDSNPKFLPNKVSKSAIICWSIGAFFAIGIIACVSERNVGGAIFYIIMTTVFGLLGYLRFRKGIKINHLKPLQIPRQPQTYQQKQSYQPPQQQTVFSLEEKIKYPYSIKQCTTAYCYDEVVLMNANINHLFELSPYKELDFIHDVNSGKVLAKSGDIWVGVMTDSKHKEMVIDWLSRKEPIWGILTYINHVTSEAKMHLRFYKKPQDIFDEEDSLTVNLIGTTKKDGYINSPRQDNYTFLDDGDLLYIRFDFSTQCYILYTNISDNSAIGEVDRLTSKKLREKEFEFGELCPVLKEQTFNAKTEKYGAIVTIYW